MARNSPANSVRANLPTPSSPRGRRRTGKILEAARDLFLELGYHATSIDMIVHKSGGSKGTLYSYFPSKEDLFRAVVQSIVSKGPEPTLAPDKDITKTLLRFAEHRMRIVSSEENLALVRLVLAEQKRFPDIAATYWKEGPQRRQDALRDYFKELAERGVLDADDPQIAADQFVALLTQPWYMRQLYLPWTKPSARARSRHAKNTIETFLRLYRIDYA